MAELKAYINRDKDGRFIPGSVVYSEIKPTNGNYALIVAGVEQNQSVVSNAAGIQSAAYTPVVRKFYPRAVTANRFADGLLSWIKNDGYFAENVLLMESKPSDSANAPIFSNFRNIGQTPEQISEFAGSLQAGGLGGFMHAGLTGLEMLAEHSFDTIKQNAILILQSPAVGISERGFFGRIQRKGKLSEKGDRTNLAIAKVIDILEEFEEMPNCCEILQNDGEFCNLITVLWGAKSRISKEKSYEKKMKVAMDYLIQYQDVYNWGGVLVNDDGSKEKFTSALGSVDWPYNTEVYVLTGTFINADYTKPAHFDTYSFKKFKVIPQIQDTRLNHILRDKDGSYSISLNNGTPQKLEIIETVEGRFLENLPYRLRKEEKSNTFKWTIEDKETKIETTLVSGISYTEASVTFTFDDPFGKPGIKAKIEFKKTGEEPGPVNHISLTGIYSTTKNGIPIPTSSGVDRKTGQNILSIDGEFILRERTDVEPPTPDLFDFEDAAGNVLFSNITFTENRASWSIGKDIWQIIYSVGEGPIDPIRTRIVTKDLTKPFIKSLL